MNGNTPIITATDGGHVSVVELLISKGANIHDKNEDGISPIVTATYGGHLSVVELLLSNGANVHDTDEKGYILWSTISRRAAAIDGS